MIEKKTWKLYFTLFKKDLFSYLLLFKSQFAVVPIRFILQHFGIAWCVFGKFIITKVSRTSEHRIRAVSMVNIYSILPTLFVSVYEFPFFCSQGVAYHKKCHAVINLLRFIEFRALQCSNFKTILNLSLFMHFFWSCNNSRWKHNKKKFRRLAMHGNFHSSC